LREQAQVGDKDDRAECDALANASLNHRMHRLDFLFNVCAEQSAIEASAGYSS
jgi:hypothetical protein